jgi:hypothetical protein
MRRYIASVEKDEKQLFRGQLSDIPVDDILNAGGDGHESPQPSQASAHPLGA